LAYAYIRGAGYPGFMHATGRRGAGHGAGPRLLSSLLFIGLACAILVSPAVAAEISGKLLWTYTSEGDVVDVAVSPDGKVIAAGDQVYNVLLFDQAGTLQWKHQLQMRPLTVAVSYDGQHVAAGSLDGKVILLNRQGEVEWVSVASGVVQAVGAAEKGVPVATGTADNKVSLLGEGGETLWISAADGAVNGVAVSSAGDAIAAGTSHNRVVLFDQDGRELWSVIRDGSVADVAISRDGQKVVAASSDSRVTLLNREGKIVWETLLPIRPVCAGVSPDGSYIVVGTLDGKVRLLSAEGKELDTFSTGGQVNGVALTTGAAQVVAGSADNRVYVFEGVLGGSPPVTTRPTTTVPPTGEPTLPEPPVTAIPAAAGNLTVTSVPAGASVSIDGAPAGTTPLALTGISTGSHTVVISADGYSAAIFDVTVAAGETATLAAELAPLTLPTASGPSLPGAVLLGTLACLLAVLGKRRFS
jgi:WD40 repeat protein